MDRVRDLQPPDRGLRSFGHVSLEEEDRMKTMVLAMVAGAAMLSLSSLQASAAPANGAAIAKVGQQVDTVIVVKKKKGRCPADQKRDRFGYCVPNANL
jgi:hypothetical protein